MAWASHALYGGRLRAHASVAAHTIAGIRTAAAADAGPSAGGDDDTPLVLVDTAGCGAEEAQEEEGGSYYNDGEAAIVAAVARELVDTGVPCVAIGVITPYSAQRARCAPAGRLVLCHHRCAPAVNLCRSRPHMDWGRGTCDVVVLQACTNLVPSPPACSGGRCCCRQFCPVPPFGWKCVCRDCV